MAIDTVKILQAVMEGSRIRDSKGIIPLFGVYLSLFSVEYYNKISFDFEEKMGKRRGREAEMLLIEAAQECGYATFQGIRSSWEWDELVAPMIEKPEDQIHAFSALAVAFGWGDMAIKELVPGEKLTMHVSDSYEAGGYLERYGRTTSGKCYMLCGVTAAFMGLVYGEDYPDGCLSYMAEETLCRVKGDRYCEFVARKSSVL
jgi:predicted hydrocarbon binding protein